MKPFLRGLILAAGLYPLPTLAQLTNGAVNAYFGIDGDTRNNYVKYGPLTGNIASDDWFSGSPSGYNVIDTSNAAYYLSLLQSGNNLGFNRRMSVPLYSKLNGKLWLDAVYGRDYIATSPLFDSTVFTIAAKNGDNPTNWLGGTSNIPDKNDLLDVYAHMRRDGTSVYDSLWLFTGVSTVGTSGSRYFDIELYKNSFSYNGTAGTFSTAGPDAGHTQWKFDASGNIIQTGDMILAVNFTPGSAPVVDLRIWVSQTTFTTVTPARFNFGPSFDGSTPAFGYASILSKTGATAFGAGISNYSATAAQDTTYSTPWGTELSTKIWGAQYQTLQLVETGLNITRIGLDPALYSALGINPCQSLFSNIFFKSRSSNSFSSNMQDFVTPLEFLREPVMDFSLQPDTLRCNKSVGTIQLTNNTTIGNYSWQTTDGNISGSSSDSSQININKPGTYIVSASPAIGCPATRTETIVIPIDTFPPVASINVSTAADLSYLRFFGGDLAASNYSTPFGGSQGLLWDWSGPGGFSSTIQNPTSDTVWGTYQLIVTEKRNGCKDTAYRPVNRWDFVVLSENVLTLSATYANSSVLLQWEDKAQSNTDFYEIEKSLNGIGFTKIGIKANADKQGISQAGLFSFADNQPVYGGNIYRIKSVGKDGQVFYSNIVKVIAGSNKQPFYLAGNGANLSLMGNSDHDRRATLVIYTASGQVLQTKNIQLNRGLNVIGVPVNGNLRNVPVIVSLFINNQLSFTGKAIY